MTFAEQLLLGLRAYREINPEQHLDARIDRPVVERPNLAQFLAGLGPLPEKTLLMGMALDHLPILLDLGDPAPGPILVAGDGGCGMTTFLQFLARCSDMSHDPGDIQFAAFTHFPEEWTGLETLSNSMGIWPAYHRSGRQFLSRLVSWADAQQHGQQVILLLVDSLELMVETGLEIRHNLRWLLLKGPCRRVWPVVTINARRFDQYSTWTSNIRTRILGHVEDPDLMHSLAEDLAMDLSSLIPGSHFILKSANECLPFWIPTL